MATTIVHVPGVGPYEVEQGSQLFVELTSYAASTLSYQRFWMRDGGPDWPRDGLGYIFLARIVNTIGSALYPSDWTGLELAARPIRSPESALPSNLRWVLESRPSPSDAVRPVPEWLAGSVEHRENTARQVSEILAGHQAAVEVLAAALERRASVIEWLTEAFTQGELIAYCQPFEGGAIEQPMSRENWHTPHAPRRFESCAINPAVPLNPTSVTHWIFAQAAEVEALARRLTSRSAPKVKLKDAINFGDHLVAYIRVNATRAERKEEWQKIAKREFGVGTKAFRREWEDAMSRARTDNPGHTWGTTGRGKANARSGLKSEPDKS